MNGLPGWAKGAIPAVVGLLGILAATTLGGGDGGGGNSSATTLVGAGEIFLEPVADLGSDPFTPPVSKAPSTTSTVSQAPTTATTAAPGAGDAATGVQGVAGGRPGLYGGTRNNASCDKEKLIQFLEGDTAKGAAWAQAQGIEPGAIRSFIESLTPVVLATDTRVTNHGYRNGRATPHQSVLQAGSAVLIDDRGGPRARCFCGNPLLPPTPVTGQATYVGKAWPNFAPADVKVVVPEKAPLKKLVLKDPTTGASFERAVGSAGEADTDASGGATTPSSEVTTTTTAVAIGPVGNVPEPNAIVTDEGDVDAESEYSNEYSKELATDHDTGTSWFSKGNADGASTTFTWQNDKDDLITLVRIIGNGDNEDESIRSGFGFNSVVVRVLDDAGGVAFEETVSLEGTPDPTVQVKPGVRGRTVSLELIGHEDPTCGGFSELEVGVTR